MIDRCLACDRNPVLVSEMGVEVLAPEKETYKNLRYGLICEVGSIFLEPAA